MNYHLRKHLREKIIGNFTFSKGLFEKSAFLPNKVWYPLNS